MRVLMHGHHADTLFSHYPNNAAVLARITFIITQKPEAERALRLALIKDVTELLPKNAEWDAYVKAGNAYFKAMEDKFFTGNAYRKAMDTYVASFDAVAFHKASCHPRCPWDGKTIFAKGVVVEVLA